MRETKIFNVPVRTVEEILPEVFEFIQEKFREFVDERKMIFKIKLDYPITE